MVRPVMPWSTLVRSRRFTVLVVDDHAYVREAMVVRLRQFGAEEVSEAASIDEARVRAHVGGPRDLCLLDFALLAGERSLLGELRAAGWRRVLLLSATDDPFALRAAFAAGARGYLLAPAAAVRDVCQTAGPGRPARAVLASGAAPGWSRRSYQLSDREVEVLRLVASGQSNRAAGDHLHLSALTVKSHLARIARKLGTGDRAEMVFIALRAGVIC